MGNGRRSLRLVGGYKMKRVTVFAGHYGSGKTNLAVNYALYLAKNGKEVSFADLDIVNPYFRSKDSRDVLDDAGIRFISSEYAGSNVDVPALPAEAYSIAEDTHRYGVVDVGGDDRGALALGRYVPFLLAEQNYDMWFVVNPFRPLTARPNEALADCPLRALSPIPTSAKKQRRKISFRRMFICESCLLFPVCPL